MYKPTYSTLSLFNNGIERVQFYSCFFGIEHLRVKIMTKGNNLWLKMQSQIQKGDKAVGLPYLLTTYNMLYLML